MSTKRKRVRRSRADDGRDHVIKVTLTAEEFAAVRADAMASGLPIEVYARSWLVHKREFVDVAVDLMDAVEALPEREDLKFDASGNRIAPAPPKRGGK